MAAKKKETTDAAVETKEQETATESTPVDTKVKDEIIATLQKTERSGIDDLIGYMEEIGFFTAPASGGNHSHAEGGLAEHSLNVCHTAEKFSVSLYGGKNITPEMRNSIVIAALLHDLGKCGDFGKQMYIPNILKSGKQSDAKPWKRNNDLLPLDHATRSIKLATLFIDLTEDEEFAIRYHDGLYETANYGVKGHETELYMILHWSDMWSSRVLEGDTGEGSGEE